MFKSARIKTPFLLSLSLSLILLAGTAAAADVYPTKSIGVVVFSSAGGGTDVMNRFLGAHMEKVLGQKMVVSNMPGGLGGTAAEHVWHQPHDGYTLLGVSETSTTFLVNKATSHGIKDWIFYIGAGSPGVIAVKADSPYKDLDAFLKAAREKPKGIKIGNSGIGKLWHIKATILEKGANLQFLHVPYNGSNPAILSVLSGETQAASASLGEVTEQVRAGKMRILVLTESERVKGEGMKEIPAMTEKFPETAKYLPLQQWLGFAVPKDTPENAVKALGAAFDKVTNNPETARFNEQQYNQKIALWGEKANQLALKMESSISWIAKELGVAKTDPADLGIPKPAWMK